MLVLNTPIGLHYLMFNNWIFGKALCHILMPIFTLPVYVSSWTITLISVERYKATQVTNNHSTPMAGNKVRFAIIKPDIIYCGDWLIPIDLLILTNLI